MTPVKHYKKINHKGGGGGGGANSSAITNTD